MHLECVALREGEKSQAWKQGGTMERAGKFGRTQPPLRVPPHQTGTGAYTCNPRYLDSSVVEYFPSMHKAQSLIPNTTRKGGVRRLLPLTLLLELQVEPPFTCLSASILS